VTQPSQQQGNGQPSQKQLTSENHHMLRTFQGIVLGLIAQAAGHVIIAWVFQVHIFPPNAWHVLPFVLGGAVCGAYAARALPGFFVGLPYAALVVFWDFMVDPGVSVAAVIFAVVGLSAGTGVCGWLAHRRRAPEPPPGPSPRPGQATPPAGA
jgi:hypothetical protein